MHLVVHPRVLAEVQCLAGQVEVLQGRSQCNRSFGDTTVLCISVSGRDEQECERPVPGCAQGSADLSYNADLKDPEVSPPLNRAAKSRLYST